MISDHKKNAKGAALLDKKCQEIFDTDLTEWAAEDVVPEERYLRELYLNDVAVFIAAGRKLQLDPIAKVFYGLLNLLVQSPRDGLEFLGKVELMLVKRLIETVEQGRAHFGTTSEQTEKFTKIAKRIIKKGDDYA